MNAENTVVETKTREHTGRAAIVTIGNELTEGRIVNTNAAWLSRELEKLAITTSGHVSVPDTPPLMHRALQDASSNAAVVVVSGGLGPTCDDRTRDAAAVLANAPLELDEGALAWINSIFKRLRRPLTDNNRRQALFPKGADVLPNPIGTAPGFALRALGASYFFLPGVPRELKKMFHDHVAPRLRAQHEEGPETRALRLNAFVSESRADALLTPIFPATGPVRLSFNISGGALQIHLRATAEAKATSPAVLENRLAAASRKVRSSLGLHCFSEAEVPLPEVVVALCRERKLKLAFAGSCTGGLACHLVAQVPEASAILRGGVVAYANGLKERLLDVPAPLLEQSGAVSEAVALAMAKGSLAATGADLACAITGIAGPSGGTDHRRARIAASSEALQAIHYKDVDKPAKYSGTNWVIWSSDFTAFLERRDRRWPGLLRAIDKASMDPLTDVKKAEIAHELSLDVGALIEDFTAQLYEYLKNYTSGEALSCIVSRGRENSWESWRTLCDQGKSRRKVEVYEDYKKIMNPQQAPLETLLQAIAAWERDVLNYTVNNDEQGLTEENKKLCIEAMCPEVLQ